MILCVNLNAAIDKTIVVSPFRLNEIHRPQQVIALPGGKGCNVARALKTLDDRPMVTGWVGGFAGQFIESGLKREGIETGFVYLDTESRTCISIRDAENGTLTEIYEKGDPVPAEKTQAFKALFQTLIKNYAAITLSGSLPPGVPPDFYAELIDIARNAGVPTFLDTSGAALQHGIEAQPTFVKPNQKEFADLLNAPLISEDVVAEVARRYKTNLILSLGADGVICSDGDNLFQVRPPRLKIQSAVGSGDCLLAGIVFGFTHGFPFKDALCYGVAAGTANALSLGAGFFTKEEFDSVLPQIITSLDLENCPGRKNHPFE